MRPEWQRFFVEQRRYLPYLGWGVVASLVLTLATTDAWDDPARLLRGLAHRLAGALVVGTTVVVCFAALYAALTLRVARGGSVPRLPAAAQVGFGAAAATAGLAIADTLLGGRPGALGDGRAAVAMIFALVLVFFFHSAARRSREEALQARAAAAEARTDALEREMKPHFLFNALNGLAEMIESGHPDAAGAAHALSDLYRRILAHGKRRTGPLGEEADLAACYLELERVRFGERLTFEVSVPPELAHLPVPSLVIQTLAENAVKHGVAPARGGGRVEIAARRERDRAVVSVANSGAPLEPGVREGTGLANTRERLDLLLGRSHGFSLVRDGAGRTVASFSVPVAGRHA